MNHPDIAAEMRVLVDGLRRYIAQCHLDLARLESAERLNARDAEEAYRRGFVRMGEWHAGQAMLWRTHAEHLRGDIRKAEADLANCDRWVATPAQRMVA